MFTSGVVALVALASVQQSQSLRSAGAEVERLATGFEFVEGPASDTLGNIYFSDIPAERVYIWSVETGEVTIARTESGGANGLAFAAGGDLIAAEFNSRQVTRMTPDGEVAVLVAQFEGGRFNGPNDVWIDRRGGVYFTDPAYQRSSEERDIEHESVYYVAPGAQEAQRVTGHFDRPNGVVGSVGGETLYVTEHMGGRTWAYDVEADGTLSGQRLFVAKGADGMAVDHEGNVYLTNLDASSVDIYAPDGLLLESISVPERPANVTFGGQDRRTLFITATTSLYAVRMRVQG